MKKYGKSEMLVLREVDQSSKRNNQDSDIKLIEE